MNWEQIAWALMICVMIAVVFPRARQMLKEGREGTAREWMGALIPLVGVALFVFLLVKML